jgi:DNA-binding IscR family transcriptional regulator
MGMLRRAGIITSQRGAKGGYHLAQEPWQIRIIDVVVALNGEDSRELQNDSQVTPEKLVIADIRELTRKGAIDVLSKHTLEDLVRKCEDKKRSDITHIPLVMEGEKQLRNRCREEIVALAGRRKEM